MDAAKFASTVQEGFLKQYGNSPTWEGAILDLLLGNEHGQVIELLVREHFGNSNHNSVSFKVLVDKDKSGLRAKLLDWGKNNNIRQDLERIYWVRLLEGKSTSDTWESFKYQLIGIQDRHVTLRVKDTCGRYWEPWITRDIMTLVGKKT